MSFIAEILRKLQGSISKVKCFCWPKIDITSLLHSNVKYGIQLRVYKINKEMVIRFSQFMSIKVEKILRKS